MSFLNMSESFTDVAFIRTPETSSNIIEEPTIDNEILYYDMSGEKYLTIFNHYSFKTTRYFHYSPVRTGTQEDVTRLTSIFQNMNYNVICHNDLEYTQIIDAVVEISKKDHKTTSCLCFAFLTHGFKGGDLMAADRPYQFKVVTTLLENGHPSLVGKPKIFFIQACRGEEIDSGRNVELDGSHASVIIPTHADFLILYSSIDDFISFRDRDGSFMIQELCKVIEEYHKEWDILHIITLMHRRVAYFRSSNAPTKSILHDKKQMPETRYSLTKLLKL